MIEATAAGAFDAVLHSGDCAWGAQPVSVGQCHAIHVPHAAVAYDLEDDGGVNGNVYMNGVQPIASQLSYAVGPGNHEVSGAVLNGGARIRV